MTVFILGAGFSRAVGMPLATELTDELVEMATENGTVEDMSEWLELLKKQLHYLNRKQQGSINIEELFHYAQFHIETFRMRQHLAPVGRNAGETPWTRGESCSTWLQCLEEELVKLLFKRQASASTHLETLRPWANSLKSNDCVLTFNYDTLVELTFQSINKNWNHGFREEKAGIPVLKLHGSIDWFVQKRNEAIPNGHTLLFKKTDANNDEPKALEDDSDLIRIDKDESLNLLVLDGDLDQITRDNGLAGLGSYKQTHLIPGLGHVWSTAWNSIRRADEIVVIGFSMSEFDAMPRLTFADAMIQRIEAGEELPRVTIIDPCADQLRHRFEEVFDNVTAINSKLEDYDWSST